MERPTAACCLLPPRRVRPSHIIRKLPPHIPNQQPQPLEWSSLLHPPGVSSCQEFCVACCSCARSLAASSSDTHWVSAPASSCPSLVLTLIHPLPFARRNPKRRRRKRCQSTPLTLALTRSYQSNRQRYRRLNVVSERRHGAKHP